jgi:hypothetical protein
VTPDGSREPRLSRGARLVWLAVFLVCLIAGAIAWAILALVWLLT